VDIYYRDDELAIDVCDSGRGASGASGGHGLLGMRERVAAYGGQVSAGPLPDGGFRVAARLPLDGDRLRVPR
jgi:signal transduction histidine kinase